MYFNTRIYKYVWVILVTCLGWNIAAQTTGESTLLQLKNVEGNSNQNTYDHNSRSGTCARNAGSIYGDPGSDERGYCLTPNALNDGLYVAGSKDNKILILEVDLAGEVRWSKTFDLFPGEQEYPFAIILDSDGMLAVSGASGVISVGGIAFILRYDPQHHQVLWTKEYESVPNADSDGIIQKGVGGNYLMANNLNVYSANHIDTEILEIDKNTGVVIPSFSNRYRLSNRESLLEIGYDGNFVYGTGRYRDDGATENFRNAIVKLDPNNGSQVWAKLGHIPKDQTARLYGSHLLIDNNAIISGCYGDSAGLSTDDSKLFLQKTSVDGNLIWIRKYELFGTNVYCLGIIKSGNGYVVLCSKKSPETSLIMFKIDPDGKLLWSNTYRFPGIQAVFINPTIGGRGNSKVIEAGNKLVFTGYVTHASDNNDILIVQTDLEGKVDNECTRSEPFQMAVHPVSSPVFYDFQQSKSASTPQVAANVVQGIVSLIQPIEECTVTESIKTTLEISICDTESYEGYTLPGIYQDTFHLSGGCDSIRTLELKVNSCANDCSSMINGVIYGNEKNDERGYCLVATAQKDGVYVAGTKNDSTLLVRFDLNGNVIWSKTFDIIPNVKEKPVSILLDSEGMLAIAGVAGVAPGNVTGYIFRYDPVTHVVLWSKHYRNTEREIFSCIIQKGSGGNYIVVGTHSQPVENHDDAEILEINKNNGTVIPAFTKGFKLWGTESLFEIVYDGQFLYATGRYKDKGAFTLEMRNTIAKLDPATGNQVWVRMGHKKPNQSARLYGSHLIVDGKRIISGYNGDPGGQSTTNTKVFFQVTDLDGNYKWIKQYEIPGANDLCYAVTKSGFDYVFLLGQKASPSGLYLVKIDAKGQVLWAKRIILQDFIAEVDGGGGNLKLIEVGDQLILTAHGINASGKSDLLLIRTDLNGESNIPCVSTEDIQITPVDVAGPEFYEVTPDQFSVTINVSQAGTLPVDNTLLPREECAPSDTIFTDEEAIICHGISYEGYSVTGVYADAYTTSNGCDSIRTLELTVIPPVESFFFQTICEGEEFMGYTTGGIHLDTFKTLEGCDSVRTVQLSVISCEPDCGVIMGSIYGDPDLNETADCLAATPQNDGMYVAGIRNQHVILMQLNLKGVVSWSKVFDVVQNKPEFVNCIMVDSDGNILLSGIAGPAQISQGGTPFALKYDPFTHQVLWSKEFTTHSRNYNNTIIQMGPGGNYMLSNNPHLGFTDDEEIIELNINTGDPVVSNTRNYRLMGSESVNLLYHEGFIYGVGRYTSNAATEFMRHTIVKIDPDDGSQLWVKMGHIGPDDYARLYGVQMVIDQDEIYSCYFGDPNGTNLSTTKMFVQKTSTSGTLRWVKQYDLPGGNDAVYAIAKSGNGLVLLAGQYNNSLGLNLFKIDRDGNIVWSKKIDFDTYVNATPGSKAISKLIEVGNILAFTSISRNASGEDDMLIGRTDLNGESDIPCLTTQDVSIAVINIINPRFYSVTPSHTNSSSQFKSASLNVTDAAIEGKVECVIADTLYSTIVHSMCTGDVFDGYTDAGTYVDLFTSIAGCDSIRTLILDVGLPSVFQTVSFCEGGYFENYDEGGSYIDTLPGIIGCDTVRHLTLIETPAFQNIVDVTICSGTAYSGYEVEGMYADTFQTAEGCDSIRVLQLTVDIPSIYPEVTICSGGQFETYTASGLYTDTIHGAPNTCDTLRHLTLIVSPPHTATVDQIICEGQSYEGYSVTGFYTDTLQTVNGCDSIRILQLSVMSEIKINKDIQICLGDMYEGYTQEGIYPDTLQSVFGCDSIIQLHLTVIPEEKFMTVDVCEGGSFEQYSLQGQYIDTIQGTTSACDTIRHITLVVMPAEKTSISYTICAEDHFNGHTEPGEYSDTLVAADGCITIQTVLLSVREPITSYTEASLCDGSIPGPHLPGVIVDTLISSLGCDSIRTLSIEGPSKYIPNAFSPNQDGNNDLFEIFASSDTNIDLDYFAIFDRFGDMTYETSEWPVLWDGNRLNGQPHPSGVYAYILIYQCGDERIMEHGNITLVK